MGNRMTCVVTGATSGIGYELARIFAQRGATVVGVGRDPARCAAAAERLRVRTGNPRVRFEVADLSSLVQVRGLAARLSAATGRIDVLVNNAGGFAFSRRVTDEGVERQFALNYLSGFLLTRLLLPVMVETRVVMVSSGSHYTGRIHWRDVGLSSLYNGLAAYDQSKLALVMFTGELARRLGPGSAGEPVRGRPRPRAHRNRHEGNQRASADDLGASRARWNQPRPNRPRPSPGWRWTRRQQAARACTGRNAGSRSPREGRGTPMPPGGCGT